MRAASIHVSTGSSTSAASAAQATGRVHDDRILHPGGRQIVGYDLGEGLEQLEAVAIGRWGTEHDDGFELRKARLGTGGLGDDDEVIVGQRETFPRPGLELPRMLRLHDHVL